MRIRHPKRRGDAGYTLVELMVVMVIITILIAVIGSQMMEGKKAGGTSVVVATARAYAAGVNQYAIDHRGTVPVSVGGTGWPSQIDGPADAMIRPQLGGRYIRSIPESVSDNQVSVGAPSTNTNGFSGYFTYQVAGPPTAPTSYTIGVFRRDGKFICSFGTSVPAATACSKN